MPATRFRTVSLAAGFVLALASCGGGGGVDAKAYVRSVCTATTDWQKDIQERTVALAGSLDPKATLPIQKQALVDLLGGLVQATDAYADKVDKAGVPDVDGGEDAAAKLVEALERIAKAFRTAHDQAGSLPTDSKDAFQQAADAIGKTVNSSVTGIEDPFKDSTELNTIAGQDPACKAIQG